MGDLSDLFFYDAASDVDSCFRTGVHRILPALQRSGLHIGLSFLAKDFSPERIEKRGQKF